MAKKQDNKNQIEDVIVIQRLKNGKIQKATKRMTIEEFASRLIKENKLLNGVLKFDRIENFKYSINLFDGKEEELPKLKWYDYIFGNKINEYNVIKTLNKLKSSTEKDLENINKIAIHVMKSLIKEDTKNTSKKR